MNNKPHKTSHASRRRFLKDSAKMVCGVGIGGLSLAMLTGNSRAKAVTMLRPPGALPEEDFTGACVGCGLCVRSCPYDTLRLARPGDPARTGSPYFIARDVPCEMCEDIPCVAACPTGALDKGLVNIDDAQMGVAVLVGHETCLSYLGLRCEVCYRVCPAIDKAITLEMRPNLRTSSHAKFIPVVHSDHCTGCGKCEKSCILEETAIRILPRELAVGKSDHHYRLGWEEKAKKGAPLIPGIIDLPDRVPEKMQ